MARRGKESGSPPGLRRSFFLGRLRGAGIDFRGYEWLGGVESLDTPSCVFFFVLDFFHSIELKGSIFFFFSKAGPPLRKHSAGLFLAKPF